jgi:hypothetical protein|tara:strand:- start:6911 stop:7093 length:183 start_codon:yes stop_codon:yes gene_type:complete
VDLTVVLEVALEVVTIALEEVALAEVLTEVLVAAPEVLAVVLHQDLQVHLAEVAEEETKI